MKIFKSKILKRLLFTFLVFAIFGQLTTSCLQFRMSQKEATDYFKEENNEPIIRNYKVGDRKINYAEIGYDSLPVVIFFHGAPGGWNAFVDFMKDKELLKRVKIISVDRPGYGDSDLGKPVVSLKKQAALLKPILQQNKNNKIILIGHSLGGPIIARLSMDYPKLVDGLIFVAASIDPELEKEEWYRPILRVPPIKWLIPASLFATNEEICFLKDELTEMLPYWKNITIPTIIIQGEGDKLVPKANADFAKKMLVNAPVQIQVIPEQNHFIPWNNPDLIKNAILDQLGDGAIGASLQNN